MLRNGLTTLALFAILGLTTSAQAAAINGLQNGLNSLQDTDYETFVDNDGSGTPTSGDFFVGMFSIDTINGKSPFLPPQNGTYTGALVAAIDGPVTASGVITFRALTTTEYGALQTSLGGPTVLPNRDIATSVLLVYDKPVDPTLANGFTDPSSVPNGVQSATHGTGITKAFEFGISPTPGVTYAQAQLNDPALLSAGLIFRLALNTTENLTPVQINTINSAQSSINQVDLVTPLPVTNLHIAGATNRDNPGGFQFQTDAVLKFNATVPEPGSFTLLALGAFGLLGSRLRRKDVA